MILKIISSCIIIICCSLLGIHMSKRYGQRIVNIRILQNILTQLETEIVHYSTFLPQAIENSINSLGGEWEPFFKGIINRLQLGNESTVAEAWGESLKTLKNNPFIGKAEYEIMYRFGKQLGSSDKKSQEKYFELVQNQLTIEEKNAQESRLKYEKMYRSLGLLLGLSIAIILF